MIVSVASCLSATLCLGNNVRLAPIETEVTFQGDRMQLAGTLSMPSNSSGPVPAMLLLPGSGPTDRDGNSGLLTGKIDTLKQIAENLAANGIATLRFDKRAIARYKSSWPQSPDGINQFFSYDHFIGDAKDAYRYLRSRPNVDPKRVGILGHSEGGLYGMQIASDLSATEQKLWKLVLMSAAGRTFGPVVHDQLALRLKMGNASSEQTHLFLDWWDAAAQALATDHPLPPNMPPQLAVLINPSVMDLMSAYCRIDPADLLAKTTMPVLVLNGSDDTQVSPVADAPRLAAALSKRPGGGFGKLVVIDQASHNYKSTAAGNRDASEGPLVPATLSAIDDFLVKGG